jgi:kynureninase
MAYLRQRSKLLTAYLEGLIRKSFERKKVNIDILTPTNPDERGAQLSIRFAQNVRKVHSELEKRGIVVSVL